MKNLRIAISLSFLAALQLLQNVVSAQSIGTTSSYGCANNTTEVVFYLTGGTNCGSPLVTNKNNWSVSPSTGVSISHVKTSSNPNAYNQIKVKFANAGTYSISTSYSCSGGGSSGSASLTGFQVQAIVAPGLSITSDKTSICGNNSETVTFTAQPVNGGTDPAYQWKINGNIATGQSANTFIATSSILNNGDVVTATLFSNLPCASPTSANSTNSIPITVTAPSPVSVSISTTQPEGVCPGGGIAFTATASNVGSSPSIQWEINGNPAPPGDMPEMGPYYLIYHPGNWNFPDNAQVRCIITSSESCASPIPSYSNVITVPICSPETFSVSITVEPFRYPPIYCADEVTFRANTSHSASDIHWYKNGEILATGETYDPVFYDPNDVISVQAYAASSNCLSNTQASADLATEFFSIEQPLGDATIYSNQFPHRCIGEGTSYFYAVADNAGNFVWSITAAAGSITGYGTNNSSAVVNWNASYTGTAVISVTATGCNGNEKYDTFNFLVSPLPTPPPAQLLLFCDFEQVRLSAPLNGNHVSFKWYKDNALLGVGPTFPLSAFKAGSYQYEAEVINVYGCISEGRTTVTVSVSPPSLSCNDKLNWIETLSYSVDETNAPVLVSHSRSFFDLTGKLLQGQVKSLTKAEILSSASVEDRFGRVVLSTLGAPTGFGDFLYKHWFVTDSEGNLYDHQALGNPLSDEGGTVGWYYSEANTLEQNVPATAHPYSRVEYYEDGTGEVKFSAGPGEVLGLGGGHEVLSGTFPLYHELDDYLTKRTVAIPGIVQDGSLMNEGVQSVMRDQNGKYVVSIADKSGKTVMTARKGTASDYQFSNTITSSGNSASENYRPMTYFYILHDQPVSLTGSSSFVVEDIVSGERKEPGQTFAGTNGNWPAGFYRILLAGQESEITLSYVNYLTDISWQFYDDAGRIKVSVSPNGFKALKSGVSFNDIDKTTYQYNHRGWLLEMTEPDADTTRYKYRKDVKIRFSQNALQKEHEVQGAAGKGKFSYTNYDEIGRPAESGEYTGSALFSSLDNTLEFSQQVSYENSRKDWVRTHYDYPVSEIPNLPPAYTQTFVRGAVSWTENANIKTWYSYDELGRVTWMAQKPEALERTFVVKYTYGFAGNVLTVFNASYAEGTALDPFYHHYEYDQDMRLVKAYTSTDGVDKNLRASYEYYLHGPLKRIELGDKVQGIDFVYNIHGWLTQINHPDPLQDPGGDGDNGVPKDVFGLILDYYETDMAGLFTTSSVNSLENHYRQNHVAGTLSLLAGHQPLIRFDSFPGGSKSYFRKYSAEHYLQEGQLIPEINNNETRDNLKN